MNNTYSPLPYTGGDVLTLLGLPFNSRKDEQNPMQCPFCGARRFYFNITKGCGQCFKCGEGASSKQFYAAWEHMSEDEAEKEIKERLGIDPAPWSYQKRQRRPREVFVMPKKENIAPQKQRDKVYRTMLSMLSLSEYDRECLYARGFEDEDIARLGYKTMPCYNYNSEESRNLCRKLMEEGCDLHDVPGFYLNEEKTWCMTKMTEGIITPCVNYFNQVVGLMVRKDDNKRKVFNGELEGKCGYFSTKGFSSGAPAKSYVHISTDFKYSQEEGRYIPIIKNGRMILTEGIMKADLASSLMMEGYGERPSFMAVQGVEALTYLPYYLKVLKVYGLKDVALAYDMDYLTNPNVQNGMRKARKIIEELGLGYTSIMSWDTNVPGNPEVKLKGIDDMLAYNVKGIVPQIVKKEG